MGVKEHPLTLEAWSSKVASVLNSMDRYISRLFLGFFLSGILIFLSLFVVLDSFSKNILFRLRWTQFLLYYGVYGLDILYQVLPIVGMGAMILTLNQINKRGELMALFGMGVSLARILIPLLSWMIFFMIFSFYLEDQILPWAKKTKKYIVNVELEKKTIVDSAFKTDKIWYRSGNIIFNIKKVDVQTQRAFGLTFYYFSTDWRLQQVIAAQRAQIGNPSWILKEGSVTLFLEESETPLNRTFKEESLALPEEFTDMQSIVSTYDFLNFKQLSQYIKKSQNAGLDMTQHRVELQKRLSYPMTMLFMALLLVPFVVDYRRGGGVVQSMYLILFVSFIFWTSYRFSISMGNYGYLSPFIAAWGTNFLALLGSVFIFQWKGYYMLKRPR